jgi:hypothetical protein
LDQEDIRIVCLDTGIDPSRYSSRPGGRDAGFDFHFAGHSHCSKLVSASQCPSDGAACGARCTLLPPIEGVLHFQLDLNVRRFGIGARTTKFSGCRGIVVIAGRRHQGFPRAPS